MMVGTGAFLIRSRLRMARLASCSRLTGCIRIRTASGGIAIEETGRHLALHLDRLHAQIPALKLIEAVSRQSKAGALLGRSIRCCLRERRARTFGGEHT